MPASSSRCASLGTFAELPPAWRNTVFLLTQLVCVMLLSTILIMQRSSVMVSELVLVSAVAYACR